MKLPQMLKEQDKQQIGRENSKKSIKSLEDIVLIHKTDYVPMDGIIKCSKDAGVMAEYSFYIGDKEYTIQYPSERETVHFCLNGEVTSHSMGDFKGMKYAVIIPFTQMEKDSIIGGTTVDTYTKGSVLIPEGGYLLCPQDEVKRLRNVVGNVNIVGYEGKNVDGYANLLASEVLGYKLESIGEWSWENLEDNSIVLDLYSKRGLKIGPHSYSDENEVTDAKMAIHRTCEILKLIQEERIIVDRQTYEGAKSAIKRSLMAVSMLNGVRVADTIFNNPELTMQLYQELEDKAKIKISEEMQEEFKQMQEVAEEKDKGEAQRVNATSEVLWRRQAFHERAVSEMLEKVLENYQEKEEVKDPMFGKYIQELTGEEKKRLEEQIRKLCIASKEGYSIIIPTSKIQFGEDGQIISREAIGECSPIILLNSDEAEESIVKRIANKKYFSFDGVNINTYFATIQPNETIEQYITRMQESISLMDKFCSGEKIEFDKNGVAPEQNFHNEKSDTGQKRQGVSGILASGIEVTKETTRIGDINQAKQMIVAIQRESVRKIPSEEINRE